MPLITVAISQGRTPEQIRAMIHEVHAAVHRTVGAQPDHIRVIVQEIPRDHWATGDVTLTETDHQKRQGP